MKKLVLSVLAIPLLLPMPATGQNHAAGKSGTAKAITISGRVSEDAKNFFAKNGDSWSITNPEALAGHESQLVKVKCQISSGSHEIRVLSLKTIATQIRYAVHPSDSAFRR